MIPTGKYIGCRGCGRLFPEGCVRGKYTCSDKCKEKVDKETAEQEAMIQKEIEATKARQANLYHI